MDVSYVLFCEFSYILQKLQGNHDGIKMPINQLFRLISVMYPSTLES